MVPVLLRERTTLKSLLLLQKIFYLKNKESVTIYCTKHSEHECVQKLKYQQHNGGGTKNKFKITKVEENED